MQRTRRLILTMLALLLLSSVASATSQAFEGPYLNVGGKRLEKGEGRAIEAKLTKEVIFKSGTLEVVCKRLTLQAESTTKGSSKGNLASAEYSGELSECSVVGNGSGCKSAVTDTGKPPPKEKFDLDTFPYKSGDKVLTMKEPAPKTGLFQVKFSGECTVSELSTEGSVGAEVWSGGKSVKLGEEPAESETGELNYPEPAIKFGFVEEEGKTTEVKAGLKAAGKAVTVTGRVEFKLTSKEKCGVLGK